MSYSVLRYIEDGQASLIYRSTESTKYIENGGGFRLLRKLITRIGNAFTFLSG